MTLDVHTYIYTLYNIYTCMHNLSMYIHYIPVNDQINLILQPGASTNADKHKKIVYKYMKKIYLVGPDKLSDPWTALFRAY